MVSKKTRDDVDRRVLSRLYGFLSDIDRELERARTYERPTATIPFGDGTVEITQDDRSIWVAPERLRPLIARLEELRLENEKNGLPRKKRRATKR